MLEQARRSAAETVDKKYKPYNYYIYDPLAPTTGTWLGEAAVGGGLTYGGYHGAQELGVSSANNRQLAAWEAAHAARADASQRDWTAQAHENKTKIDDAIRRGIIDSSGNATDPNWKKPAAEWQKALDDANAKLSQVPGTGRLVLDVDAERTHPRPPPHARPGLGGRGKIFSALAAAISLPIGLNELVSVPGSRPARRAMELNEQGISPSDFQRYRTQ